MKVSHLPSPVALELHLEPRVHKGVSLPAPLALRGCAWLCNGMCPIVHALEAEDVDGPLSEALLLHHMVLPTRHYTHSTAHMLKWAPDQDSTHV